jgi:hypothetical protein
MSDNATGIRAMLKKLNRMNSDGTTTIFYSPRNAKDANKRP